MAIFKNGGHTTGSEIELFFKSPYGKMWSPKSGKPLKKHGGEPSH